MGRRARFRGTKIAPKSMEKNLIDQSRRLAENPQLLMPRCEGRCLLCEFKTAVSRMEKVSQARDDPKKLEAFMTKGDRMVKAYAGTISLSQAGKAPVLAVIKLPTGDVSFAVRGSGEKEQLIGMQHFDDPKLRLMAYWKEAQRRDLHIYSMDEGLVCCKGGPRPPQGYIDEVLDSAPYDLDEDNSCPHPDAEVKLQIHWKTPDIVISVCKDCASDASLLHHLASRIAARDPADDFDVEVKSELKCYADCANCNAKREGLDKDLRERYKRGEIDDRTLIRMAMESRMKRMRSENEEMFIVGNECFGTDKEKFLARIRGSDLEKKALAGLLSSKKVCIVSSGDQAANIISMLWSDHKDELLEQVASPEVINALDAKRMEMPPAQVLQEAWHMELSKGIEAKMPQYEELGPVGKFADQLARAFKLEGKDAVMRMVEKSKGQEHKLRSISYAFLAAMNEAQSRSWQFSKEEMDFGTYLKDFASSLMESEGEKYHEALKLMITASGSMEETKKRV